MGRKKNDIIRGAFEFDGTQSKCKNCNKSLAGSYLTNLQRHLNKEHSALFHKLMKESELGDDPVTYTKKRKIVIEVSEEEVTDACIDLITVEGRPLTFLDSSAFRIFSEPIFNGLKMTMINSHSVLSLIEQKYESMIKKITRIFSNRVLSLKIDAATRHDRQLFCVNTQIVGSKSKKIEVFTLGVITMDRRLTAENLRCEIEKILNRFDISVNQIFTITSDNGRNMIKATEILRDGENENSEEEEDFLGDAIIKLKLGTVQSVRCAAHTLQLAVHSFLNDSWTDCIVRKVRDYMKNLRTPTHRFGIAALNLKRPVIDIPTRWNTTSDMLASFLALRPYWAEHFEIDERFVTQVALIVKILESPKTATLQLQQQQMPLGDFVKIWWELRLTVEEIKSELAKRLLTFINEREKSLLDNPVVLAAIYLDPRIRRLFPKEKLEETKKFLKTLASQIISVRSSADGSAATRTEEHLPTSSQPEASSSVVRMDEESNDSLLNRFLDRIGPSESDDSDEDRNPGTALGAAIIEIEQYENKRIDLTADIFLHWSNLKYKWPYLSEIALTIHAVPATQVTVERAFSAIKFILNDLRYRLSPTHLEQITILKLNSSS